MLNMSGSEIEPKSETNDESRNCDKTQCSDTCHSRNGESSMRKKKRRRARKRPYSAKHFLGRPKINAPANTTQFLCADKEYYSAGPDFDKTNQRFGSTSNSESESSQNTSYTTMVHASNLPNDDSDDTSYQSNIFDNDHFFTKEFDQMYDDIRAELLCNESVEELTSRCIELESAVHNLEYLLQKEIQKRQQIQKFLYMKELNQKLLDQNILLKDPKTSHSSEESYLSNNLNEISIDNSTLN